MTSPVFFLLLLATILGSSCAQLLDVDHEEFLKCADQYCLGKNYSKLDVPFNEEGRVDIAVDLDVLQILEVDDIKFTVSFSMYFGVS